MFRFAEEKWKKRKRGMTPPMMLGFFSVDGIQDTIWTQGGKIRERIEATERKGQRSVFDALVPLKAGEDDLKGIFPSKAIGFFRISVHLPWIKDLFGLIQKSKNFSISMQNQAMALNTIRGILGMPIPKNVAEGMGDFVGNREITLLLALPSPGSFWPEIFLLSPKNNAPLSREARLMAISKPIFSLFRRNLTPLKDSEIRDAMKVLGRKKTKISYLNYMKLAMKNRNRGLMEMVLGVFPGGGKFSVGSNDRFEILSFSPSALRGYLRGKRASEPRAKSLESVLVGKGEGELLQGVVNLGPLVKVYPFQAIFSVITMAGLRGKKKKLKIPPFAELARLLGPETFGLRRLPPQGEGRGVLVLDHEGGALLSPFSILGLGYSGVFFSDLMVAFKQ